jgi:putative ABC transport system permease protein
MAIRAALGAGKWRIVRQALTESLLLALAGGALGFLVAVWGVAALRALAPNSLPRLNEIRVNPEVLAFTAGISLFTGILFGLAPAIRLSRGQLQEVLKEGGRGSSSARHRLGNALVVGEVALSIGLLLGGGLLLHSFWRLVHVNPGFRPDHVLTAALHISNGQRTKAQKLVFYRALEERLITLPGVEAVGMISELPLSGQYGDNTFQVEGRVYSPNQLDDADLRQVTPGFLVALRIPLLSGRWIGRNDTETAPGTVVVNDAFVQRFFSGKNPIGQRVKILGDSAATREIVGVVGTLKHGELNEMPRSAMYVPLAQYPPPDMNLVVRTAAPLQLAAAIQETVSSLDKDEAISVVRSMDDVVGASVAQPRFSAQLLGLFATMALVLAAVGIYGLIAYTVSQRTHEIGIRMALGATRGDVSRMVLAHGLRLALAGAAIGLAGALALTRLLRGMLFGVSATDPFTFAAVTALLLGVALIACWIPARRAMRVDPMIALRYE